MAQNRTWTITQSDVSRTFTISPGVGQAGPNNITTATSTDITGILKGDGANVSAAVDGTDYQGVPAEGAFIDGDKTKLDGIEAGADVTDAANVDAAGAVMESDYSPAHSVLAQQSGTGSPSSVTLGTNSLLGRASGAGTAITGLTAAQARTLLNVEDGATADQTAAEILTAIKTVDGAGSGLDADLLDGQEASAFATAAQGTLADSAVQPGDIDTLAELNAIITDATLIDTTDSRLSDARTPTAHTHTASDLDFAGSTDIGADLADADEVLVSDGGGNTTRVKSALSRFWTYIKAKIESVGLSSLNISGDLTVDTSTLKVDSANNRVGIGTASPATTGHVYLASASDAFRVQSAANFCQVDMFGGSGGIFTFRGATNDQFLFTTNNGTTNGWLMDTTGQMTFYNGIAFNGNSGTWDGATIAGNQTFSGQVELTGQAASTDDSAMTRGLVDSRVGTTVAYNLSGNAITSSTTLTDICAVTLPTGDYKIKLFWVLNGTANTGTRHGFTFTGTTGIFRATRLRGSSIAGVQLTTPSLNLGLAESDTTAWVEGIMNVTASGDLKLQAAQNTSHPDALNASGMCYIEVTPIVDLQAD